ncbi:hypothetical protein GGI17_006151 [Coemansia sp. S146]|nr:hypothetical protein GGI17_006151 [Coemansia sp. S146]
MFIQEAGQFGPHPNLSDPRLVSSRIPIAQWEGVCPSNSSDIIISAMCIEEHIPELQYVPGVSWAIVLENHAYPWSNVPKHVQHTLTPLLAGFYNPPLLRNDFTRSRPKLRPLATLKDKGLAADVYPLTIDVELELAGVRQGWVLAQAHLEEHICPTMKTVRIKKLVPAPWDPTKNATRVFTQLVYDDGLIPLDAVRRLSVPLLLVFILSRALIVASLPIMVLTLHHDLMSASRWTGVSRATIATMYVGAVVSSVQLTESFGVRKLWALFWQFVMVYIGVNMDDMTFAPLAGLSWMVYNLFWRKSSPITTSQSSAQEQTPVVTDKAIPDSAAPEVMPNSHSNLVDPVVAIRRSVDRVAMYWIHLLAILAIATAVVYHMLIRQEYSLSSLGVPNELFIGCMRIVQSVVWLPQIIVNHKAKSGSLVPVAFVIPTLVYSVASAIFYHLSGYNMFGEITAYSFPVYLSYVILLLQWIMYRKVKQD